MNFRSFMTVSIFTAMAYFGTPALSQAETSAQTTSFVHAASVGNKFEIESSKLALKQTSAKDVKDFAQMMVTDHTQLADKLKETLASSGTGLSVTDKLDDNLQKTLDDLKAAPPPAFDNLYVQAQSKAHDEAVNLFTDYAANGDNTDLKKFAADTLPILKKHQELVHSMTQSFMSTRQ